ncbi:MAG TPA: thiosulfate sulfurtransferase, partial [Alcanivorax sp.]|nr:thiosulfate sulfurtransferase [Alcanivorax sp.]HBS14828.1 thiosulfate sulfurtransferase [Alcanivorax sp.]
MAERISPEDGVIKLQSGDTLFVDVRDPASHQEARIPGSLLLNQSNLEDFLAATDR